MSTATLSRPSLTTLMNRHGTDKLFAHHYDGEYTRHFEPLRDKAIRLLEIGIGGYNVAGKGGESLRVWHAYFPNAQIIGIDIEDKRWLCNDRITTVVCDQSDEAALLQLNEQWGPFDVIIDDGSHIQSHILTSFNTLFPCLAPGGIYVIEDLATAYRPEYQGTGRPLANDFDPYYSECQQTVIGLLARLIDCLHYRSWKGRTPSDIRRAVKSVHVSEELAFIYKK